MRIVSLKYKGFRGRSFKLNFKPGVNAMIGMNGCGKTNALDLIAIITGTSNTTDIIRYDGTEEFEFVEIVVQPRGDYEDTIKLTMRDRFDLAAIAEFKSKLEFPASYILRENMWEDEYVGPVRADISANRDNMLSWLKRFDMPLGKPFDHDPARGASLFISETGAQRYILTVGMRRPDAGVVMLLDAPDRHLHIMSKRVITSFYRHGGRSRTGGQMMADNQIILTTHSPEVIAPLDSLSREIARSGGSDLGDDQIIDMMEHVWK